MLFTNVDHIPFLSFSLFFLFIFRFVCVFFLSLFPTAQLITTHHRLVFAPKSEHHHRQHIASTNFYISPTTKWILASSFYFLFHLFLCTPGPFLHAAFILFKLTIFMRQQSSHLGHPNGIDPFGSKMRYRRSDIIFSFSFCFCKYEKKCVAKKSKHYE